MSKVCACICLPLLKLKQNSKNEFAENYLIFSLTTINI